MKTLKIFLKNIIPASLLPLLNKLPQYLRIPEYLYTQHLFNKAEDTPAYLPATYLPVLNKKFPPLPEYEYDPEALLKRGRYRARHLTKLDGISACDSFLEVGCGDGMVSYCLNASGKRVSAVDFSDNNFDHRVTSAGVDLHVMDAAALQFPDEHVDVVFSFNAFEHFPEPEKVLSEFTRITKRGGFIYLNFGPLYYSPWGEHAYRSFTVPYCQFLFTREVLNAFASENGLDPVEEGYVNGLTFDDYEALFASFSTSLDIVKLTTTVNRTYVNVIRKYPSCFKSKNSNLKNFVVSEIEIVFRKR